MRFLIVFLLVLLPFSTMAYAIEEDKSAARILVYHNIGYEDSPANSVTLEQFKSHIRTLHAGQYNVVALPDIIKAYKKKAALPPKSVVITFDNPDKSLLLHAVPLLKAHQLPFTVFLSPEDINDSNPHHLTQKDIRSLKKIPLINFGLQTDYDATASIKDAQRSLNKAVAFYRDNFKKQPDYFAFSHGLYDEPYLKVIENYKFTALLGQHSAVAYHNKAKTILPRFVMTENYADKNRFNMIINALPIPAEDTIPSTSILNNSTPSIGFTVSNELSLDKLSCYAAGQQKPMIENLNNRIEIRLKQEIDAPRFRVNCTLPVKNPETEEIKWRWLGFLFERP